MPGALGPSQYYDSSRSASRGSLGKGAGYQQQSTSPLFDGGYHSKPRSSLDDRTRSLVDKGFDKRASPKVGGMYQSTEENSYKRGDSHKNDSYKERRSESSYTRSPTDGAYGRAYSSNVDSHRSSMSLDGKKKNPVTDRSRVTFAADNSFVKKRATLAQDNSFERSRTYDEYRGRRSVVDSKYDHQSTAVDDLHKGQSLNFRSDQSLDGRYKRQSLAADDKYQDLTLDEKYRRQSSAYDELTKGRFTVDDRHTSQSTAFDDSFKGRSSVVDDRYTSQSNGYKSMTVTHGENPKKRASFADNRYAKSKDRNASRNADRYDEYTESDYMPTRYRGKKADSATIGRKGRTTAVTANLGGTRYEVVRQVADACGLSISREDDPNSFLIWNDSFVSTDKITEMKPYQKINHFPGMGEVCRKDCLARNMAKMAKVLPEEFSFVPRTWIFPSEYGQFQNYAKDLKKKKKNKTFIVKPANGAMGNGISLYRNAEKVPSNDQTIVQEYLEKPLLVEGFKCDLRIYVLMTSCDPLRIFLYNDGLLRLGTEKYLQPTDHNVDHLYMHLTNYSVNKHSENYDKSATVDTGSKRTLKFLNEYLRRHDYDVAFLWRSICDLIIKTLIVAHPHVLHAYRMCRPGQAPGSDSLCFEVLGFDVMLDKKLRPWLLEINRSPSFGTDEKLDYDIKSGVIEDTLRLLNIKASDKRKNMAAQKAQAQKRLMRPTKRVEGDLSEIEKKKQTVEKRKEELKELLARMRKEAWREDFESRNSGRFRRIFPPDDKFQREKYAKLLSEVYTVFMSGRAGGLQQEIQRTYNNKLREEDVLDLLAQCEADEKEGRVTAFSKAPRGPKPLQSMPTLSPDNGKDHDTEGDEDKEEGSPTARRSSRYSSVQSRVNSNPKPSQAQVRSKSLTRSQPASVQLYMEELQNQMTQKDQEEELTKRTLTALNDMRIKFPGKSDQEAEYMLDKLHENWKYHKPRVASYWLVKLDSIKRRKVTDIVHSNVRAVLQRTWKCADIESLPLYRIFSRVFNRLLWSRGQGLWNCFQTSGNSWETIFSKSTDAVTSTEMACCRRIVQLCRDCLLIVYQFAADARGGQSASSDVESSPTLKQGGVTEASSSNQLISQRLSRLYKKRSSSLNSLYGAS